MPKRPKRAGLSPTLSWKWPHATLSSSFGPLSTLRAPFGVKTLSNLSKNVTTTCPWDPSLMPRKKIYLQAHQKKLLVTFVISFNLHWIHVKALGIEDCEFVPVHHHTMWYLYFQFVVFNHNLFILGTTLWQKHLNKSFLEKNFLYFQFVVFKHNLFILGTTL